MTAVDGPVVTVRFGDTALVALVVDAARGVDGVVRLQRRPVAAVRRFAHRPAAIDRSDASAVTVTRDAAGALDVGVRLVSSLSPRPLDVVAAVTDAVRRRLAVAGLADARVEVTVTDVQR